MAYAIEAIPMTFSHLQGHSLMQAPRCDFCPRDAMLAWYLLSSRVRLTSVCHKLELYWNSYTKDHADNAAR